MTSRDDREPEATSGSTPDEPLELNPETILDLTIRDPDAAEAVKGGNDTCRAGMSCKPG